MDINGVEKLVRNSCCFSRVDERRIINQVSLNNEGLNYTLEQIVETVCQELFYWEKYRNNLKAFKEEISE